jgi:hypothetical protein
MEMGGRIRWRGLGKREKVREREEWRHEWKVFKTHAGIPHEKLNKRKRKENWHTWVHPPSAWLT